MTGRVVNAEKIQYVFIPGNQSRGEHQNIHIDNKYLKV